MMITLVTNNGPVLGVAALVAISRQIHPIMIRCGTIGTAGQLGFPVARAKGLASVNIKPFFEAPPSMSRKPKNPTKTARERARKAMSAYIRQKYADHAGHAKCVSCGTQKPWQELDAGHFIPKGRSAALEFLEENVHPQCPGCNRFDQEWAMIGYTQFMELTYGRDFVLSLQNNRETIRRRKADYEAIEAEYKQRLAAMLRLRSLSKNHIVDVSGVQGAARDHMSAEDWLQVW